MSKTAVMLLHVLVGTLASSQVEFVRTGLSSQDDVAGVRSSMRGPFCYAWLKVGLSRA